MIGASCGAAAGGGGGGGGELLYRLDLDDPQLGQAMQVRPSVNVTTWDGVGYPTLSVVPVAAYAPESALRMSTTLPSGAWIFPVLDWAELPADGYRVVLEVCGMTASNVSAVLAPLWSSIATVPHTGEGLVAFIHAGFAQVDKRTAELTATPPLARFQGSVTGPAWAYAVAPVLAASWCTVVCTVRRVVGAMPSPYMLSVELVAPSATAAVMTAAMSSVQWPLPTLATKTLPGLGVGVFTEGGGSGGYIDVRRLEVWSLGDD